MYLLKSVPQITKYSQVGTSQKFPKIQINIHKCILADELCKIKHLQAGLIQLRILQITKTMQKIQ